MKTEQNNTHKSKPKPSDPQSLEPGMFCGGTAAPYSVSASPKKLVKQNPAASA